MTGSEKQIKYAEALKKVAIARLTKIITQERIDYYKNKSIDGLSQEKLERRYKMIAEMETTLQHNTKIINALSSFSGYAGNLIDCLDGQWYHMPEESVGYKRFLNIIVNCSNRRKKQEE